MPAKQPRFYPTQKRTLSALGERLRLARLRRKLTVDITCQRAGISRMTLFRAEAGSPAIALGTLLRILSVLGLEADLETIARDDRFGRLLQDQALTPRRTRALAGRGRIKTPREKGPREEEHPTKEQGPTGNEKEQTDGRKGRKP